VGIARNKFLGILHYLRNGYKKLQTSNFVRTFTGSVRTKARGKIWKNSRERSQRVPKILRAPVYGEHRAVMFSIAQLISYITV